MHGSHFRIAIAALLTLLVGGSLLLIAARGPALMLDLSAIASVLCF